MDNGNSMGTVLYAGGRSIVIQNAKPQESIDVWLLLGLFVRHKLGRCYQCFHNMERRKEYEAI